MTGQGPLAGVVAVELGGVGGAPFCGMVLADMGADVVQVRRPPPRSATGTRPPAAPGTPPPGAPGTSDGPPTGGYDELTDGILARGRRPVTIDLKDPRGSAAVRALVAGADLVVEGFRPGVAERLGVGPDACLALNPALVYGRITGWGQDGPLAASPGHDLDYLALTGALHAIGFPDRPPVPPLNLVADFGGGGMLVAMGLLAGLVHARATGEGQVVDAAMTEGAAYLMTMTYEVAGRGAWVAQRQANANDGGAPWYSTYETADGRYVAVAAMEPRFYEAFVAGLGLDPAALPDQWERAQWPELRQRFAAAIASRTRDEWCALLEGSDACVAPVLQMSEAPGHPHLKARRAFVDVEGVIQPAPAPRFSRTPGPALTGPGPDATAQVLAAAGVADDEIAAMRADGVIGG